MPKKRRPYLRQRSEAPPKEKTNFVREWREQRGWAQEQLSEKTELSVSTISGYERMAFDPSPAALRQLGKAFRVPGGMILDVDPTKDPTLWEAYQRATEAQRRDMGRAFSAMVGPSKQDGDK